MKKKRILVITRDVGLKQFLNRVLLQHGYQVLMIDHGSSVLPVIEQQAPNLLLIDDTELCAHLRQHGHSLPIMLLSLVGEEHQIVRALDLVVDNPIITSFSPNELIAHIHVVLRRCEQEPCIEELKIFMAKGDETTDITLLNETSSGQKITYQLQHRKCGKWRCRACHKGQGHGPYWYAYWHEGKKSRSCYIGKHLNPTVISNRLATM